MHVATSVIEDQPLRATPAEGETLYEFSQSPLLERQSRQSPTRAAIRGGFRWR